MREAVTMSKRLGLAGRAEGRVYGCVCVCTHNCLCVPVFICGAGYPCVYVSVCFQARGSLYPPDVYSLSPSLGKGTPVEGSTAPALSRLCPGSPLWSGIGEEGAILLPKAGGG